MGRKTVLCVLWASGRCHLPVHRCRFAHGLNDLQMNDQPGDSRSDPQFTQRQSRSSGHHQLVQHWMVLVRETTLAQSGGTTDSVLDWPPSSAEISVALTAVAPDHYEE